MSERDDLIQAQRDFLDARDEWAEHADHVARTLAEIQECATNGTDTGVRRAETLATRLLNDGAHTLQLRRDIEAADKKVKRARALLRMTTAYDPEVEVSRRPAGLATDSRLLADSNEEQLSLLDYIEEQELPGLWSHSDMIGGATDAEVER